MPKAPAARRSTQTDPPSERKTQMRRFRRFWLDGWAYMQPPRPATPLDHLLAVALAIVMVAVFVASLMT